MKNIKFGTGGFRAVIGEDFNKENVQRICQAVCNIVVKQNLKKEVCIGYDNRFMSENFAVWSAEVFAGNGIKVMLFDRAVSTPAVMFATKLRNNDFGIMITASHNPYTYNGVKLISKGGKDADINQTNQVEEELKTITEINSVQNSVLIEKCNYINEYVDNIVELLDIQNIGNKFSLVFDSMHGSTAEEIELFCNKINASNYEIINSKRDAFFGFKVPLPNEENLEDLTTKVIESHADIGFALDSDGDRLAVVDENGQYIDNNYILAVAYYFMVKYCGKIGNSVKNVATSNLLNVVTKKFGYECLEVPVGFKHVFKAILDSDAVVGGESSGGLAIVGHVGGKDSLLAIAICLKAMFVMNKKFGEILKEVLDFADNYSKVICDKQYSYTVEQEQFIFEKLQSGSTPEHRYSLKEIIMKDYVKVYYENNNWVLIRFSGTEPILRIFAEADTKEESLQLIYDWEEFLNLI